MTWYTVYSQTLTSNSLGWEVYTARQRAAVAGYDVGLPATTYYELRVTLTAATTATGVIWNKMYIGHRNMAGDTIDFDGTQVPLLVGGSASGSLAASGTVVTDPVLYPFDKTKDLVISVYFQGGSTDISKLEPSSADFTGAWKLTDWAATTDVVVGDWDVANRIYLFSKVEASDVNPPPAVTINKASSQADPTSGSSIEFAVVFSKAVTGFTSADISFTGSTAGGSLLAAISGTGPTYTVTVTGMTTAGDVVASIPAGVVLDAVDGVTPNTASTSTDNSVAFSPSPKLAVQEVTMVKPDLIRVEVKDDPVVHGYTEVLSSPDSVGGADVYHVTNATNDGYGGITITTDYASHVEALSILNIQSSPVSNGSGGQRIRVTVYDTTPISTWLTAQICHVRGTTEANVKIMSYSSANDRKYWSIAIINGTQFDLKFRIKPDGTEDATQPATFTNTYLGNGVVMDSGDSMSNVFTVSLVTGTTEVNNSWWGSRAGTNTLNLLDSTFTNAYVSGGQLISCAFGTATPFLVRTNPTTGLSDYCYVVGNESKQRRFIDQRGTNFLDRATAVVAASYGAIGGRTVTAVYLKSTPYSGGIGKYPGGGGAMMPAVSFRHYLYLQLSGNLANGNYIILFPGTLNVGDYNFTFNDKVTRCCAIKADQNGHRSADPGKRAYFAEWVPGISRYGELDVGAGVTDWHIIDSAGTIVWSAGAAPAFRGDGTSVEGLSLGVPFSNNHYNILESTPLKVTNVTRANPARVTLADASTLSNGDTVTFSGMFHYPFPGPSGDSGMWQLDNTPTIISNKSGNSFDIALDTSVGYSAFATSATGDQGNLCFKTNILGNRSCTYVYGLDYAAATLVAGTYYIYIPGYGVSDPIGIRENAWYDVAQIYAEGLYHERSGCLLDGRFGYTRPVTMRNRPEQAVRKSYMPYIFVSYNNLAISSLDIGANNDTKGGGFGVWLQPLPNTIDAYGGHMDAGDWDTRLYETSTGLYHILDVFDHLPATGRALLNHNLPTCLAIGLDPTIFAGTDALPSPLVEVIWGIEFARASQETTGTGIGAVWGGINYGEGVPDYQTSWNTAYRMYAYYPDHMTTFLYAGIAAKLGKILATLGYAALATTYKNSAIAAFAWAETIYDRGSSVARDAWYLPVKTAAAWSAGDYSSSITASQNFDMSPRAFGAACLFAATGTVGYKTICDAMLPFGSSAPREADPMWEYCNAAGATAAKVTAIRSQLADWGHTYHVLPAEAPDIHFTSVQQRGVYYGGFGEWNDWVGPSPALVRAAIIYATVGDPLEDATKAMQCRRALQTMMQHRHGANQIGFCWTNGLGVRNIPEALHLDSRYYNQNTPSGIGPEGPSELNPFPMPLVFGISHISRVQHPQWDPNTVGTDPNSFYREMRPYDQKCWPRWEMLIEYNTAIVHMEFTTQQQILPAYAAAMFLHGWDDNTVTGLATSTATLVSSLNPSGSGVSVTFTCTVTGGSGVPTGTVTFTDNGVLLGTDTLDGSGEATYATSLLTVGSHSIVAAYGGDTVYDPDTSPVLTQVVTGTVVSPPQCFVFSTVG